MLYISFDTHPRFLEDKYKIFILEWDEAVGFILSFFYCLRINSFYSNNLLNKIMSRVNLHSLSWRHRFPIHGRWGLWCFGLLKCTDSVMVSLYWNASVLSLKMFSFTFLCCWHGLSFDFLLWLGQQIFLYSRNLRHSAYLQFLGMDGRLTWMLCCEWSCLQFLINLQGRNLFGQSLVILIFNFAS